MPESSSIHFLGCEKVGAEANSSSKDSGTSDVVDTSSSSSTVMIEASSRPSRSRSSRLSQESAEYTIH
jgi:hypothetical protein